MDKKLFDLLCEVLPQANRFSELFIRREALIPGCVTIEGKDLKAVLDSKSFESFLQEDANKMLFNKKIITTKDELLKLFEGFPEEAKEYYEYSISILRRIILSLTNLVPTKIEDRDIKVQESIKRFLFATTNYLPYWENSIQSSSDFFNQSSDNINPQGSKIIFWVMMTGLISLNIMTITSIHFHNIVYEYFYGPADKKDENGNKLDQVLNLVLNIKANQDNTSLYLKNMTQSTEQTLKNTETTNNALNEIKECQKKTKELIENRNEEEEVRILPRSFCARKIKEVIDKYLPNCSIDYESIMKNLRNWDEKLEKGQKVPVPGYASIKKSSPKQFLQWAKSDFLEYFMINHKKGRGRGRTNSNQKKHSYSSSEAAQNEAARKLYEDKAK